jgi:DNA polymerase III subunit delta
MAVEDLKKSLAGGAVAPLYFFYGDNEPALEEALRLVTAALFPKGPAGLDVRQINAQSQGPGDILQSVRTISFFSPKKLVIVRQAHHFKEPQWEQLKDYLKKPLDSCCLVFMLLLDEKDKKDKARLEALKKFGPAVPFQNPKGDKQIALYVRAQLAKYGKTIAPDALAYYSAMLGENAQVIAGEVEKLALYCGERTAVEAADVDEVVCGGGRGTIFNLVDAVGQGRLEQSLELLGGILGSGVHPLVVLKMIARQFRLISTARLMLDQGENATRIGQRLRLPEFVVRGVMQQARGWPAERLGMVFEEIFQAHYLSKSSRGDAGIVLERLLLRLPELRS